jgi:hypothetical protein
LDVYGQGHISRVIGIGYFLRSVIFPEVGQAVKKAIPLFITALIDRDTIVTIEQSEKEQDYKKNAEDQGGSKDPFS